MSIAELLGTEDEEAQYAIVEALLESEKDPTYALVIRYDLPKDGVEVQVIGKVPFMFIYRMLELANKAIHKQEIQTITESLTKDKEE